MEENVIYYLLRSCSYGSRKNLQDAKNTIEEVKNDKTFLEYLIKKSSNRTFRMIAQEFNIPQSVVEEREKIEREIINDYENHSLTQVQQCFCDVLFHDNVKNVMLTIESVREYSECNDEYKVEYDKYSQMFDCAYEFCGLSGDVSSSDIGSYLTRLSQMNTQLKGQGLSIYDVTKNLFSLAEKLCENGLRDAVKDSGKTMFDGVEPEYIQSEDGKQVKVLKLQKQTENQEKFYFFARRTAIDESFMGDDARDAYVRTLSARGNYLSYSLFDQGTHRPFNSKSTRHITFGYFSLGGGEILSTTYRDAQTNQFTLSKGNYSVKQNLLSADKLMESSKPYNEIVCENKDMPLPDFIISSTETPTPEVIRIASAMNIPIVFINDMYYEIRPEKHENAIYYDREPILKEPIAEMVMEQENPSNKA